MPRYPGLNKRVPNSQDVEGKVQFSCNCGSHFNYILRLRGVIGAGIPGLDYVAARWGSALRLVHYLPSR